MARQSIHSGWAPQLSPVGLNLGSSHAWPDSSKPRREAAALDPMNRPGVRRRDWSGGLGKPGVAFGELDQGLVDVDVVFAGGGGVGADGGEEGAQVAGDLLPNLDHADVAFGELVLEPDGRVGGEREVVGFAVTDPAG